MKLVFLSLFLLSSAHAKYTGLDELLPEKWTPGKVNLLKGASVADNDDPNPNSTITGTSRTQCSGSSQCEVGWFCSGSGICQRAQLRHVDTPPRVRLRQDMQTRGTFTLEDLRDLSGNLLVP